MSPLPGIGPAEAGGFAAVLARLLGEEARYLRLGTLTESASGYVEPEAFCAGLMTVLQAGLGRGGSTAACFFAWAMVEAPRSQLIPVLASRHHLERGDEQGARRAAERALCLNQSDLYAQRLYRLAHRHPEPVLSHCFCAKPFDKLETAARGDVYFCCPAWLPKPIGNLERQSPQEIWNSPAAQDIRRSILDGSYRHCSRMHCPKLTAQVLPAADKVRDPRHQDIIREGRTRLDGGPRRLVLNHDPSCNLSCPSCRTRRIVAHKVRQERMNAMTDRVLMPLLEGVRSLHITGSGDPFGSAHFRHVLRQVSRRRLPGLRFDLQTNGLLLAQSWDELRLDDLIDTVAISIDAARPETYAALRRGGEFARLLDNLGFVAMKRRSGQIRRVRLDVVVQTLNFRELPEVVDLGRDFGFDGVKLQMIRSWNTYEPEEFAWHNIGSPAHSLFPEFLQVLRDPRLRAPSVEFWGFHSVDPLILAGRL
jgi:pyruvate-formate lyase-activating enzyme